MIEVSLICLILPNGCIVLQRRDQKTNVSPGLLGLFGGHIEVGESPESAIKRELSEETSLNASGLTIAYVADAELPHPNDAAIIRKIYLYSAVIDSSGFDVSEGAGSEAYSISELKSRQDLTLSTKHFLANNFYDKLVR